MVRLSYCVNTVYIHSVSLCTDMHIFKKSRAFENVIVDIRFESTRVKYKYMQSLPGHRPWLLTVINRVNGQGRCPGRLFHGVSGQGRRPGRLCHGVSGQGRRPGRLCHGVSGQGRCPGRQLGLGLGFVLAFRVEKQNIGSSRNRNPVGAVYSN